MCKVVHCNKEKYDIYIGRPSKWGNPFTHISNKETLAEFIVGSREEAIESYKQWIMFGDGKSLLKDICELRGKTLGCWCHPNSCHGDVLCQIVSDYC